MVERPHRSRMAPAPTRIQERDMERAEALIPKARDWPAFADTEPTLSSMLRLAMRLGLDELEKRAR